MKSTFKKLICFSSIVLSLLYSVVQLRQERFPNVAGLSQLQTIDIRARLSNNSSSDQIQVCNRIIPESLSFQKERQIHNGTTETDTSPKHKLIVLGSDEAYGQTNNQINTILHAMDYATDINAYLVIIRDAWPTQVLQLLFGGIGGYSSVNDSTIDTSRWERAVQRTLSVTFADRDEIPTEYSHLEPYYNTTREMYYYHTRVSPSEVKRRRLPILSFLWTHPGDHGTRSDPNGNVCSVVNSVQQPNGSYTVVHSRWMKNDQCLTRLGSLAHAIRKNYWNATQKSTVRMLDKLAPCQLPPSYIEYILKENDMLHRPIYVITDGKNPTIVQKLRAHPVIGKDVHVVSNNVTWVGGDMMLGILATVFIGTPISTMSGNIARARNALGFHPSTNYMFPLSKRTQDDGWEFFCENDECLYDSRFLSHYVG